MRLGPDLDVEDDRGDCDPCQQGRMWISTGRGYVHMRKRHEQCRGEFRRDM